MTSRWFVISFFMQSDSGTFRFPFCSWYASHMKLSTFSCKTCDFQSSFLWRISKGYKKRFCRFHSFNSPLPYQLPGVHINIRYLGHSMISLFCIFYLSWIVLGVQVKFHRFFTGFLFAFLHWSLTKTHKKRYKAACKQFPCTVWARAREREMSGWLFNSVSFF